MNTPFFISFSSFVLIASQLLSSIVLEVGEQLQSAFGASTFADVKLLTFHRPHLGAVTNTSSKQGT